MSWVTGKGREPKLRAEATCLCCVSDGIHTLTCALMLLNTDLHGHVSAGGEEKGDKGGGVVDKGKGQPAERRCRSGRAQGTRVELLCLSPWPNSLGGQVSPG